MDRIVVLDFGGQYAHLIANRLRRLRVYAEILPPEKDLSHLRDLKGAILSGGPASVYSPDAPQLNKRILELGVPLLGICYGHQLLAHLLGGKVEPGEKREYGLARLKVHQAQGLLEGLGEEEVVWMSHGDVVRVVPPGFAVLASTEDCPVAVMGDIRRRFYGLQFHPEVSHTPCGMHILENFLRICGCRKDWTMANFIETSQERIRIQVGDRKVFLLVSGGVDSVVTFALLNKALGPERVLGLHVDTGLMRKGETQKVEEWLQSMNFHNFVVIDASEQFLGALKGVVDPQEKRRIIGNLFLEVCESAMERLGIRSDQWLLGQGTLYPDIIESGGSRYSAVIKTHHNRVDRITELLEKGLVIEPLSQLYKDEVREVGRQLGLPRDILLRHPFPGPGLAVRCLCSTGEIEVEPSELAKEQVQEIARDRGFKAEILPLRSVGVQGDFRTYRFPAVVVGEGDWETLENLSTAITNTVAEVNRVVWLVAPEDLPPLKLKEAYLTRARLDLLRELDALAMSALEEWGLMEEVFQMPTILLPLSEEGTRECVVLRPLESTDVMTARFAKLPQEKVKGLAQKMWRNLPVVGVLYDITHKPPGTMEWE